MVVKEFSPFLIIFDNKILRFLIHFSLESDAEFHFQCSLSIEADNHLAKQNPFRSISF